MALSKTTQDHDEIRSWAEARGGKPAEVASTSQDGTGILRIEFPGATNSNDSNLEEIPWEQFFEKFDASGLSLVYQDVTVEGAQSNFNKLVYPENLSTSAKKGARKTAAKKSTAKKTSAKSAAPAKSAGKAAGRRTAEAKPAARRGVASKTAGKAAAKKSPAKENSRQTDRAGQGCGHKVNGEEGSGKGSCSPQECREKSCAQHHHAQERRDEKDGREENRGEENRWRAASGCRHQEESRGSQKVRKALARRLPCRARGQRRGLCAATLCPALVNGEVKMADVTITVRPNGPFRVEGPIRLLDGAGGEWNLEGKPAVSLCRCGASTKKPFCDGTHTKIGFAGAEAAVIEQDPSAAAAVKGDNAPKL